MSKITFNNKNNEFYTTLKKEVDAYFTENKIAKTGDWRLFWKSIILWSLFVGIYVVLMAVNVPVAVALVLTALLGFGASFIGFCVMHDANHGCYSPNNNF